MEEERGDSNNNALDNTAGVVSTPTVYTFPPCSILLSVLLTGLSTVELGVSLYSAHDPQLQVQHLDPKSFNSSPPSLRFCGRLLGPKETVLLMVASFCKDLIPT